MFGAIIGDIVGSPYEFDFQNIKTKEFPLFTQNSHFTDDSVMTLAVASAWFSLSDEGISLEEEDTIRKAMVTSMQTLGRKYPNAGYGANFILWLGEENPAPYGSYGNGSAMRVSSCGWLFDTLSNVRKAARLSAEVTHDHPEGTKGAEAVASAIFLARTGKTKEDIRRYIEDEFGYDLSRTCDEIRPDYHHVETCQGTVPEAFAAFLEGEDFIDVIRTAVSLGGDCDTLTCIAGSMGEAFFGVPEELKKEGAARLTPDLREILQRFDSKRF